MSDRQQYRKSVYPGRLTCVSVFAFLLFLLSAASAFAQSGQKVNAPVTVTVGLAGSTSNAFGVDAKKNVFVPLGGEARISGTSVALGDKAAVTINITAPDKSTESLSGKLTPENKYTVVFKKTNMPGEYTVTAKSPDGKSTANASFTVVSALFIGETTNNLFSLLTQVSVKTGKVVHAAKEIIDAQGDFPDRARINEDIARIEQTLEQLPEQLDGLSDALNWFSKLVEQYPGVESVPELSEVVKELSNALDEAETIDEQLEDLYIRMSKGPSVCDMIDAASEAFGATELFFDMISGAWILRAHSLFMSSDFPNDVYNAVFPDNSLGLAGRTAFTETVKNAVYLLSDAALKMEDYLISPTGLVHTLAGTIVEYAFGDKCEHFVGPVEGTLAIDFTVDNGKPFWKYKTYIKGRLVLRYEKNASNPVHLTGEFEGTATKFEVSENLYVTGELVQSKIIARILKPPIAGGDIINWIGMKANKITAMAIPYYFNVPVTGTYSKDDRITISVAPTGRQDFNDLNAHAYYVVVPSVILPIPLVERFDLPIQNAQYILSRGLRSPATIEVKTTKSPKGSLLKTIEKSFTREEVVSDGEITARWNLKVKACNPECP